MPAASSVDKSYSALGRYLVARDRMNAVLDAAIIQETGVRVFHGVLLTSALNPKQRLGVLKAILSQAGGEKQDVVPLVSELMQDLKRQPIAQGNSSLAPDGGVTFMRTDVGPRTAGSVVTYSVEEISVAAANLEEHVDALASALGLSDEDLVRVQRSVGEALAKRGAAGDDE